MIWVGPSKNPGPTYGPKIIGLIIRTPQKRPNFLQTHIGSYFGLCVTLCRGAEPRRTGPSTSIVRTLDFYNGEFLLCLGPSTPYLRPWTRWVLCTSRAQGLPGSGIACTQSSTSHGSVMRTFASTTAVFSWGTSCWGVPVSALGAKGGSLSAQYAATEAAQMHRNAVAMSAGGAFFFLHLDFPESLWGPPCEPKNLNRTIAFVHRFRDRGLSTACLNLRATGRQKIRCCRRPDTKATPGLTLTGFSALGRMSGLSVGFSVLAVSWGCA